MTSNFQRISLVSSLTGAGLATMEKSASASPEQNEILQAAWPQQDEPGLTKLGALSRMLAVGMMIEEADQSVAQAHQQAQPQGGS